MRATSRDPAMPDKIAVDASEVGRAVVRDSILERIRSEGYEVQERTAGWEPRGEETSPDDVPLLLVGDLRNVVRKFRERSRHEWISFVRARRPVLLSLIRTKADKKYAAAIDDLMRASDLRVWVCDFDRAGKEFDHCLIQALMAGRPEALIDARYDPGRRRLALQFGDGLSGSMTLDELGVGDRLTGTEARSATVSPLGTAIAFARKGGGEFEIDASAIRALLDQNHADELHAVARSTALDVGQRLRSARQRRRLTQVQLAQKTGMDQAVISRLERGENRPRIDTLRRLASALEMTVPQVLSS